MQVTTLDIIENPYHTPPTKSAALIFTSLTLALSRPFPLLLRSKLVRAALDHRFPGSWQTWSKPQKPRAARLAHIKASYSQPSSLYLDESGLFTHRTKLSSDCFHQNLG